MNKMRLISLGPLLLTAAFAVVPAVAQAKEKTKPEKPAYWSGCKTKGTTDENCQVISWGTLTFKLGQEVGSVTCKKSDAGNIWNPNGTAANGLDEITLLAFYECKTESPACPSITITALNLPWPSELFYSGGVPFDRINGIDLEFKCGASTITTATGSLTPKMVNGSPTVYEEFTAASGTLASSLGPVEVSGKDYNLGFEKGEKLKVK
jgi:hypothetical protein